MKNFLIFGLILVFSFVFSGCGQAAPVQPEEDADPGLVLQESNDVFDLNLTNSIKELELVDK